MHELCMAHSWFMYSDSEDDVGNRIRTGWGSASLMSAPPGHEQDRCVVVMHVRVWCDAASPGLALAAP